MALEDRQYFDLLRLQSIDDPIVPDEDFTDLLKVKLWNHPACARHESRLFRALPQAVHPTSRRLGAVPADKAADFP